MALTAKMAGRMSLLAQMKGPIPQNLKQDLDAIEATLDRIIAMQEELIGVETITFFVVNDGAGTCEEYTTIAGTTWAAYLKENPIETVCPACGEGSIIFADVRTEGCCGTVVIMTGDNTGVKSTDAIEDGEQYVIST